MLYYEKIVAGSGIAKNGSYVDTCLLNCDFESKL